jgi:two-component system sensor histidine kinase TctE
MAALALLLGLGGALTINNIVEGVNDRFLGASARAIAETLALEDDEVTLDIPPSALGMLENDARDNVYYSVRAGKELITGYPDLPRVKRPPTTTARSSTNMPGSANSRSASRQWRARCRACARW